MKTIILHAGSITRTGLKSILEKFLKDELYLNEEVEVEGNDCSYLKCTTFESELKDLRYNIKSTENKPPN